MSFDAQAAAAALSARYQDASTLQLLRGLLLRDLPGRIKLVSSFGAESAVLLDLVARVDRHVEVVFVDSGHLFDETLAYRDRLVRRLGLTRVTTVAPRPELVADLDPNGRLHATQGGLCCYIRKVEPLERALGEVEGWISGRKRFQAHTREALPRIEVVDGRLKINPLADWTKADLDRYFDARALPRHPLEAAGYLSIGCRPCTTPVAEGEDPRAGRWRGQDKVECGIHGPADADLSPL